MLRGKEEVVVLVKQSAVESYQGLPLLVVYLFIGRVSLCVLSMIDFNAFTLNHDQSGIYALNFSHELLLGDGSCLWLLD